MDLPLNALRAFEVSARHLSFTRAGLELHLTQPAVSQHVKNLEDRLGKKSERNLLPLQPGDVPDTCADVSALQRDPGYSPSTPIETGIGRFVEWYRDYYRT